MINFLLGIGTLALLVFSNYVILNLCKLFPKHILSISGVMIGLDAFIILGYTYTTRVFTDDVTLFVGGVGLSIFMALVHKTVIFQKTFKEMFKDEIGN